MWGIADGGTLTNPINMFEWSNTLDQQTYQLNCPSVGNEIITVIINIYSESSMPVVILLLFTFCPSSILLKICFEHQIISIMHHNVYKYQIKDRKYKNS